jgi:hypothetical protein
VIAVALLACPSLFSQGATSESLLTEEIVDPIETNTFPLWIAGSPNTRLALLPAPAATLSAENKKCMTISVTGSEDRPVKALVLRKKPVRLAGIVKIISFWIGAIDGGKVDTRIVFADIHGIEYKLFVGSADRPEWNRYSLAVDPMLPQSDYYLPVGFGGSFLGFEFTITGKGNVSFGIDSVAAIAYSPAPDQDAMQDGW